MHYSMEEEEVTEDMAPREPQSAPPVLATSCSRLRRGETDRGR